MLLVEGLTNFQNQPVSEITQIEHLFRLKTNKSTRMSYRTILVTFGKKPNQIQQAAPNYQIHLLLFRIGHKSPQSLDNLVLNTEFIVKPTISSESTSTNANLDHQTHFKTSNHQTAPWNLHEFLHTENKKHFNTGTFLYQIIFPRYFQKYDG